MVTEENRDVLRERLLVWKGPLPFNITESPSSLARFVREHGAGVLFVDSLKDVAVDLIKDEVGSRVNQAVQELLADGVEVCLLHHQRKQQAASGSPKPTRLADVYGSRWLTAGMGSVVLLWGDPGDLIVEFRHLKQPAEEVGPLTLVHDHDRGVTSVETQVDAFDLVRNAGAAGVTAEAAAEVMFTTEAPSRNEIKKARRRLEKLAEKGLVVREGERPQPVVYRRAQ
jgi:replicative DNA helicase